MSSRRPAKVRKKERDDSTDEDDDRPLYFCPGEGLDMEVVVSYVRGLVNKSAEIKVGVRKNRNKETIEGFDIRSNTAIDREDIRAMIEDTRAWYAEMRRKKDRFYYHTSETAANRLALGRAKPTPAAPMYQVKPGNDGATAQPTPRNTQQPRNYSNAGENLVPTAATAVPSTAYAVQILGRPYSIPNSQASGGPITQVPQYTGLHHKQDQAQPASSSPQYSQSYYARQGSAPPPYESADTKMTDGGSGGGSQPSTTGTIGFVRYATAGPPGMPRQQPRENR